MAKDNIHVRLEVTGQLKIFYESLVEVFPNDPQESLIRRAWEMDTLRPAIPRFVFIIFRKVGASRDDIQALRYPKLVKGIPLCMLKVVVLPGFQM